MDLAYGIPSLALLLLAFAYVRRLARREAERRRRRTGKLPKTGVRSLSQRSEMRAGDDLNSVMDDIQRTQSAPLPTQPSRTRGERGDGGSTRSRRR